MSRKAHLKAIADSTIEAVEKGILVDWGNRVAFPLWQKTMAMMKNTRYYDIGTPHLVNWRVPPRNAPSQSQNAHLEVQAYTTLQGLRYLQSIPQCHGSTFGVLNFASGTRPGGGFRNGASAQEESLARSSNLFKALESDRVTVFYDAHRASGDPFHSHAMIYSPGVVFFRDDGGAWVAASVADVLTCAAVDARSVRTLDRHKNAAPEDVERWIRENMEERMGRLLELFEHKKAKNLVLGSFGTGVYQNDVGMVARIWRDLLYLPNARFRFSFQSVVFAIPDAKTLENFKRGLFDVEDGQHRLGRGSRHGGGRGRFQQANRKV